MKIEIVKEKEPKYERAFHIPSSPLSPDIYKLYKEKKENGETIKIKKAKLPDSFFNESSNLNIDFNSLFFRYTNEKNDIRLTVLSKMHSSADSILKSLASYVIQTLKIPTILSYGLDFEEKWLSMYPFDLCIYVTEQGNSANIIDEYKESKRIVLQKIVANGPRLGIRDLIGSDSNLTHSYDLIYPTPDFEYFTFSDENKDNCAYYPYSYQGVLQQSIVLDRKRADSELNKIRQEAYQRNEERNKENERRFEEMRKEGERRRNEFLSNIKKMF